MITPKSSFPLPTILHALPLPLQTHSFLLEYNTPYLQATGSTKIAEIQRSIYIPLGPFPHIQLISKSCQFRILSLSPVFQAPYVLSYYLTLGPWPSLRVSLPVWPPRVSTFPMYSPYCLPNLSVTLYQSSSQPCPAHKDLI